MLTKHPHIVEARPPRRTRRKKPAKAFSVPAIVGPRQELPLDEEDPRRRSEAADKVWQELIRGVSRRAKNADPK